MTRGRLSIVLFAACAGSWACSATPSLSFDGSDAASGDATSPDDATSPTDGAPQGADATANDGASGGDGSSTSDAGLDAPADRAAFDGPIDDANTCPISTPAGTTHCCANVRCVGQSVGQCSSACGACLAQCNPNQFCCAKGGVQCKANAADCP